MEQYLKNQKLILNGNLAKAILILAGPIMLNNFIQTIYNLADTFWVSKLGSTELAAITFIWPVIFFCMGLGFGINIAGTSLISQYIGAKRQSEAAKVAGQLVSFSFLFSLIIGLSGYLAAPFIIHKMGGEGELFTASLQYLRIIFLGMPFMFVFMAFIGIKQGQGDTYTPMKYSAISVIINIILDPIFIFTFRLGIGGAALATIISRAVFTFYAIYTLFYRIKGIQIKIPHLKINRPLLKKIIKIGLPSSIGQSTAALGFIVLNIFIISFGESTLAAFGIGNRINSLVLMPAMGIGNAMATIVGQNLGADQLKRTRRAVKTSTLLVTIFLVCGALILYPLIPAVVSFFSQENEISRQAIYFLKLVTLALPLMGFFQVFIGIFQGSGHTVMAMILMMSRLWALRIPMIIVFKTYTSWGSNSVWYAMVLSNGITCIAGYFLYLSRRWEKKVISKKSVIKPAKL